MLSATDMLRNAAPDNRIDGDFDMSSVPQTIERFTDDLKWLQVESEDPWPLGDAVDLIVNLEREFMFEPDRISKEFAVQKSRDFTARLRKILGKADQRTHATNGVLLFLGRFLSGLQRTDEEKRAEYEIENIETLKCRLHAIHQTLTRNPDAYSSSRQLFSAILDDIENTLAISRSPKSIGSRVADISAILPSISINTKKRVLENHSRDINMVEETMLSESHKSTELELRRFGRIVASTTCPQEMAQIEAWLFGQEYHLGIINDDGFNEILSERLTNVLLMATSDVGDDQMQNIIRDALGAWFANAERFIQEQPKGEGEPSVAEKHSLDQKVINEILWNLSRRLVVVVGAIILASMAAKKYCTDAPSDAPRSNEISVQQK